MHYVVGELLSDSVFDLTITVYDNASGSRIGALQLGVCLAIVGGPHDLLFHSRASLKEMKRSVFFQPQWGLLPNREPALGMKIRAQEEAAEQPRSYTGPFANVSWRRFVILIGLSHSHPELNHFETTGGAVSPHFTLIDPDEVSDDKS